MKRTILRIICFFIILIMIISYADGVLRFKYGDGIYSLKKFYELEDDTVDVLILGSSHAFENFNTGTLWDEYGIAAYDLGGSNQSLWNTYHYLKEALKTQHPKLIILEGVFVIGYEDYDSSDVIIKNTYGLRWSYNKAENMLASIPPDERWDYIPEGQRYHNRYSELTSEDFLKDQGNPLYYDWKGFGCNMDTIPFERVDVSGVADVGYMSPKSEWYYNHIIELAKQYDIPIEIIIAPYPACNEDEQKVFNKAQEIATEKDVPFLNCNVNPQDIGINYATDFADEEHLNYKGNRKFTKYIGKQILSKYDLPDHRGDEKYQTWENDAAFIRREIANQRFKECESLKEYQELILSADIKEYDVFMTQDDSVDETVDYYIELPHSDMHVTNEAVTVGGKEYDLKRNDINIVVYDRITDRVEDYVGFDKANDYLAVRFDDNKM